MATICDPGIKKLRFGTKALMAGAWGAGGKEDAGGHGVVYATLEASAKDVRSCYNGARDEEEEKKSSKKGDTDVTCKKKVCRVGLGQRTDRECWICRRRSACLWDGSQRLWGWERAGLVRTWALGRREWTENVK